MARSMSKNIKELRAFYDSAVRGSTLCRDRRWSSSSCVMSAIPAQPMRRALTESNLQIISRARRICAGSPPDSGISSGTAS